MLHISINNIRISFKKGGVMAIKQKYDYDIIVIGSGAAGSSAATIAAHGGKKVAIINLVANLPTGVMFQLMLC